MKSYKWEKIITRSVIEGNYILHNKSTLRETAKALKTSKSTVHKDVTERLWDIDEELAREVYKILLKHKKERHMLGGEATRQKYLKLKEN